MTDLKLSIIRLETRVQYLPASMTSASSAVADFVGLFARMMLAEEDSFSSHRGGWRLRPRRQALRMT